MTNSRGKERDDDLSALIRDQLRDPANRQLLSRLPVFSPDHGGQDVFGDLLVRLDRAETRRSRH
jgi:hypothetical protein